MGENTVRLVECLFILRSERLYGWSRAGLESATDGFDFVESPRKEKLPVVVNTILFDREHQFTRNRLHIVGILGPQDCSVRSQMDFCHVIGHARMEHRFIRSADKAATNCNANGRTDK